ncbi:MAG: ArsA family ATPase, partial [Candidatus Aenigmatarchaeota archaeon]
MRVILFTGKGGVGKTTISAATALKSAKLGYRTLTISTDQAHSLSDSFGIHIGSEVKMIADRLWVQEIDIHKKIEENWGEARDFYRSFLL